MLGGSEFRLRQSPGPSVQDACAAQTRRPSSAGAPEGSPQETRIYYSASCMALAASMAFS